MTARPQDVALLPPLDPLPEDYKPREWECTHQAATYFYQEGHAAALASAQAREEELRAECARLKVAVLDLEKERSDLIGENARLEEALREARAYVASELAEERAKFAGYEHCSTIASIEADLARIDAALSTNAATQTGGTT